MLRIPWISITFFLSCCKNKKTERLSNRNKLNGPKIITGTVCCISGFPPGASGSLHQKENREASPFCYFWFNGLSVVYLCMGLLHVILEIYIIFDSWYQSRDQIGMLEVQMLVNILRSMKKFFASLGSTTILPDALLIPHFSDITL